MTRKASKGGPRGGQGRTAKDDEGDAGKARDGEDAGRAGGNSGSPGGENGSAGDDDTPREQAAQDRDGSEPDGEADLADPIARLEVEVAEWKDKALRARADYQNLERRVREEAAIERDRVKARVLEGFLQVYEYSQMAAFEAERNPGPLADGVRMVVREFDRLLDHEGVRPISEVGGPFDPKCHEAVAQEPAEGVGPGRVSRVVAQGYRLGDRVLRFAKVAVAPQERDR